jgi:hypothetical protein
MDLFASHHAFWQKQPQVAVKKQPAATGIIYFTSIPLPTKKPVTVDENIVTAADPDVADKFAWKIIEGLEHS